MVLGGGRGKVKALFDGFILKIGLKFHDRFFSIWVRIVEIWHDTDVTLTPLRLFIPRSEMTLNYRVIVERYPFPNGVVGGSIPVVKSSLYLTHQKNKIKIAS
jgi:hypothetical protein